MPVQSPDGRDRHALVSTHDGDWDSVPDTDGTLSLLLVALHVARQPDRGPRGVPRDPVPRPGPGQVPSIGVTEAEVER